MNQRLRPRRSVLYMPASNDRAVEKARTLPADCIVFDLEDGVAPEAKPAARDAAVAAVRSKAYGNREVVVRINAHDSEWADADLAAVAGCGADAVLVPKVETVATIDWAQAALAAAGAQSRLWIMTETPRGVLALDQLLAAAAGAAAVVVMGTSDLARDMRVSPGGDRAGLLGALSASVLVARAHGVDIIDGVHLALDDMDGYRAACRQGRKLGFDGKSLIHPRQIEAANECFGVTEDELALAREIVAEWRRARAEGRGLAVVRGQLVEQLHADDAERIIGLYEAVSGSS